MLAARAGYIRGVPELCCPISIFDPWVEKKLFYNMSVRIRLIFLCLLFVCIFNIQNYNSKNVLNIKYKFQTGVNFKYSNL